MNMRKKPLTPVEQKRRSFRRLAAASVAAGIVVPSPVTGIMMGVVGYKGAKLYLKEKEAKRQKEKARVLRRLAAPEVESPKQRVERRLAGEPKKVDPLIPGAPQKPRVRTVLMKKAEALQGKKRPRGTVR